MKSSLTFQLLLLLVTCLILSGFFSSVRSDYQQIQSFFHQNISQQKGK